VLASLDLQYNNLSNLPSTIASCSSLTYLDVSNNNLASLPSLKALKSLVVLRAGNNQLGSVPDLPLVFDPEAKHALTKLDLSFNKITEIPEGFGEGRPRCLSKYLLPGLLQLSHLEISDNKIRAAPHSLGQLKSLLCLNLSKNEIEFIPPFNTSLPCLKEVYLGFNRLSQFPAFLVRLYSSLYYFLLC
jgi:Leucine-rich repeat (LRR) protein